MAQTVDRQDVRAFVQEHYRPEALGLLARQLLVWQRFGMTGWVAFSLAVCYIAVLTLRQTLIPYPIVYDPDGRMIWHGTAVTPREERFIDVRLVEWVAACRAVSSDETRFREDRERCAASVYGKAAEKFEVYNKEMIATYKDRQRRRFVQVDLQKMAITRQGSAQVQITWEEVWTPEFGYGAETKRFQAMLTHAWYARPSRWTLDQARLNPSRVYVVDFFWDEIRVEGR